MKRKTAKELLAESFRELAEKKNIDKITIKEITDNCGYSPATFYRQFKDKYDLIAWDYAQKVEEIMNQVGVNDYSWEKTLLDGANYFQEQKKYLSNLLLHTRGLDSFEHYMTEANYNHLRKCVLKVMNTEKLDEKTDLYIRLYCMGTVRLNCEWILGKIEASPEDMAEVYEKSLPEPLHRYLQ